MFSRFKRQQRPDWRQEEIQRLESLPRYVPTSTSLLGKKLELPDAASFLAMYREIWEREIYSFPAQSESPLIIDGGANIGVSAIYFKHLHPQSRVIAFEPDPHIFTILRKNVESFELTNVDLIDKALWSSTGQLNFESEGSDSGKIIQANPVAPIQIQTVRLRDFINESVELLKLDIEGAETEVLVDCEDVMSKVRRIFVEYHSFTQQPQSLNTIFNILFNAGMRVHVHQDVPSSRPFQQRQSYNGMDLQLNIFGFRDE